MAASASGVSALQPTSPLGCEVMSHFSSRRRFWSARGSRRHSDVRRPALEGEAGRVVLCCGARKCRRTGHRLSSWTVLLSGTPLLSLETVAEVPFELYQHHLIVTKGSIGPLNGRSLLIDTGTIPSMVDVRIARKLHLQAEPSMLVAFGQSVAIQSTVLNGFRIGALQTGPVPAGVSDLSYLEGVRIDAIVGLDVLARTSFSIDYRKRVLRFSPGGREESVAPLELAWPFVTVRMTIAGQQVRLLVDTGSSDLVLFKSKLPAALVRCALERRQDRAICVRRGALAAARPAPGPPRSARLGQAASLGARSGAGRIPAEHRRRARCAGPRLPASAVRLRAKRARVEPVKSVLHKLRRGELLRCAGISTAHSCRCMTTEPTMLQNQESHLSFERPISRGPITPMSWSRTVCWTPTWNKAHEGVGLEHLLLHERAADSVVVAVDEERGPFRLTYRLAWDDAWRLREAELVVATDRSTQSLSLRTDGEVIGDTTMVGSAAISTAVSTSTSGQPPSQIASRFAANR